MNTASRIYLLFAFSIAFISAPIHANRSPANTNDRYTYTHYPPSHYQHSNSNNNNNNQHQQRHTRTYPHSNNNQSVTVHYNPQQPYNPHQQCNVPSDFWCDSHEMAQKCGVVSQCDVRVNANIHSANV